jgi:hypothetical protein
MKAVVGGTLLACSGSGRQRGQASNRRDEGMGRGQEGRSDLVEVSLAPGCSRTHQDGETRSEPRAHIVSV